MLLKKGLIEMFIYVNRKMENGKEMDKPIAIYVFDEIWQLNSLGPCLRPSQLACSQLGL